MLNGYIAGAIVLIILAILGIAVTKVQNNKK